MSDGYGPGGYDDDLVRCDSCGGRFQPRDVLELQGRTLCVDCKGTALARMQAGEEVAGSVGGRRTPWDRRGEIGIVPAFWQTCMAVMTRPGEFFAGMDKRSESLDCLILPAVIAFAVQVVGLLVNLAFTGLVGAATAGSGQGLDIFAAQMGMQAGFGVMGLVLAPVMSVVGIFIGAGIAHVILLVMKEARVPYIQTVRGYCYANCVGIIGMVPVIGQMASPIWVIVVSVIMLMKFHRTGVWPALMAVLLLPLLCCGVVAAIMVVAIGAAAAQ